MMMQPAKDEHGEYQHYGLKMDSKTTESRLKSERGGLYSLGATEPYKIPKTSDLSARGDIKPLNLSKEKEKNELERAKRKRENIFKNFDKLVFEDDELKTKTYKIGRMMGVDLLSAEADGEGSTFFQEREEMLKKNVVEYLDSLRKTHPSIKKLPKPEDMEFFYGRVASDEDKAIQFSISGRLDKDNWENGGCKYYDMETQKRLESADGDVMLTNRCKFMAAAYDQVNVTWFKRDKEKIFRIKVVPQITQIALTPDSSSSNVVVTPDEFDQVKLNLSDLIERKSKDEKNPGPQHGKTSAIVQNNGRNLTIEIQGEFRINKDKTTGQIENNGVMIFHEGHRGDEIKTFVNETMTDAIIQDMLAPKNKKILKNFKKKKPTAEYLRDQGNSFVRHPQDEEGEEDESRPANYKINLGREMLITMADEDEVKTLSREEFDEIVTETGVEVTAKLTYSFLVFGKSDWSNKPRAVSLHIHRKMSGGARKTEEVDSGFDLFGDAPDCKVSKESVDDDLESPEDDE